MRERVEHQIQSVGLTDTGLKRVVNEDSILTRDDESLWMVADGMGGHVGGRWASQQVRDALASLALSHDFETDIERIRDTVSTASAAIAAEGESIGTQMGTTVAILHVSGARFAILWAGDSRVYLHRLGQIRLLTTDHTSVQQMVDLGLLTQDEASVHPQRHILSRAVGVEQNLQLDLIVDKVQHNDRFLLCSDGLTAVVSVPEIAERMAIASLTDAADSLLELTLARGAPDNVTIIAVSCTGQGEFAKNVRHAEVR
jgi:serine/threonine protein phosphatase PrpC